MPLVLPNYSGMGTGSVTDRLRHADGRQLYGEGYLGSGKLPKDFGHPSVPKVESLPKPEARQADIAGSPKATVSFRPQAIGRTHQTRRS